MTHLLVIGGTFLGHSGGFLEVFWRQVRGVVPAADNEGVPARCSQSGTTSILASGLFTEEIPIGLCSPVASRGGD